MPKTIEEKSLEECSSMLEKVSDELAKKKEELRLANAGYLKLNSMFIEYQYSHEFYNDDGLMNRLKEIVIYFQNSAPTVSRWADEIYMDLQEDVSKVTVLDIYMVKKLMGPYGSYIDANLAANLIYKHMEATGKDVTGHLGF